LPSRGGRPITARLLEWPYVPKVGQRADRAPPGRTTFRLPAMAAVVPRPGLADDARTERVIRVSPFVTNHDLRGRTVRTTLLAGLLSLLTPTPAPSAERTKPPNVVLIIADDMA
jgi:hypothetical protein